MCFKRFNRSAAMARWCAAACLMGLSLYASAMGRYGTMESDTISGTLEGWVYAEHEDEVGDFPSDGEITLNGKLISTVKEVNSIQYDWGYPKKGPFSIEVVSLQLPYPQECPAQFMLVELRKDKEPIVIDRFGNCNDDPHVSYKFGQVVVYFPKFGPDAAEAETAFVYEDGKMHRVKVTRAIRKGTWTAPIK